MNFSVLNNTQEYDKLKREIMQEVENLGLSEDEAKKSYNKMNNSSYDFSGGGRRKARRGKRKTARRSARKTARRSARRSARKTARRSARRSNRKRVFRGGANG